MSIPDLEVSVTTRDLSRLAVLADLDLFVRKVGDVAVNDDEFGPEVDLFHCGYLDSLGIASLINHIENHFEVQLRDEDLSDPGFHTLHGISNIIISAALRHTADRGVEADGHPGGE